MVGELQYRVEHRRWGPARRARLKEFLRDYIVVHSAPDIVENWARLIERQDAWIAAVALTFDLPLVTHNAAHFRVIPGLQVLTSPDQ